MKRRPAFLLLLGAYACDGADGPAGAPAGVPTMVTSPPYAEWTLDPVPVTRIGAVGGPPELQLSRVAYAARLTDGSLVVADGASSELRWFGADGRFRFRAGGRGEGPGEFLSIVSAAVTPRDTTVVYDFRNQRLTWFGPRGSLSRTFRAELNPAMGLVPFGDTRLVVAEERPIFNFGGAEYNYTRDTVVVMVTGRDPQSLDTLMRRPGREAATWVEYTDGTPTGTRQFGLPFGHPTLVGAPFDHVVMVEHGRADLRYFNEAGELVRSARRADVDPPLLPNALRQQYVRHAVDAARERGGPEHLAEAGAEALLALVPEGQRASPFDRMLTDAISGRIWVRDYLFEWDVGEPQRWTVHDAAGRVLARVTTPSGLEVMHVGPEHVVGVERGRMGVEYVVAYRFEGPG